MKIEQKFHDYCEGCPFLDVVRSSQELWIIDGAVQSVGSYITCDSYQLCEQLWDRLSTIRNDPPDLMEQIATICREKGISVEEAVELFKRL